MKWLAVAACVFAALGALMLDFMSYIKQGEDDVIEHRPITLPLAPWGFFGLAVMIAVAA